MKVAGKEYYYRIEPTNFGRVSAEVYYIFYLPNQKSEVDMTLISKNFGWFRIKDKDYKDAKEWCERTLSNIYHSNKDQSK